MTAFSAERLTLQEEADALRKCTGAVKVTMREEVRMADGTLRVISEAVSE
jgi:hypothetical protein